MNDERRAPIAARTLPVHINAAAAEALEQNDGDYDVKRRQEACRRARHQDPRKSARLKRTVNDGKRQDEKIDCLKQSRQLRVGVSGRNKQKGARARARSLEFEQSS